MKWLIILFFATLVLGQLGALPLGPGVTIYSHDIFLTVLVIFWLFSKRKIHKGKLLVPIGVFIWTTVASLAASAYVFPPDEF